MRSRSREDSDLAIIDRPIVQDSLQKEKSSSSNRISSKTNESIFGDTQAERRKKKKDPEKEVMQRYFGHYAYIDTRTLKSIKTYLQSYIAEEKAKDRHDLDLLRSINRRQLLKIFLIAYAQLKFKQIQPMNEVQQALMKSTGDCYSLLTIFVCMLEEYLFQQLYKDDKKPREEPYQIKMKILKAQLNDKYNFDLRRAVINRTISFPQIVHSSEEDLKSQERKQEQKISLKCLVDQSQSWPIKNQSKESYLDDSNQITQQLAEAEQQENQKASQQIPLVVIGIEDNDEEKGNKDTEDQAIIVGSNIGYKKILRKSIRSTNRVYQKCSKDMRDRVLDIEGEAGARLKEHYKKTFK